MALQEIRIGGARQHNLKNVSLSIPRNKLVVITGPSGSGKSSLAFDTLYAEGQRRYVESLSVYARQFLEQMEKPDVDYIEGLSPAIAIEQRTSGSNPRSTIATTTEIYDFLRLFFAHLGQPHHPVTGKPLRRDTIQQMVDRLLSLPEGTPLQLLAPVVRREKGEFRDVLEKLRRDGFLRARIDGEITEIEKLSKLEKNKSHTIEVVVDRLKITPNIKGRLTDSLELALKTAGGVVIAVHQAPGNPEPVEWVMSNQNFDPETGYRFTELTPRHFSFNSPQGACPACHGLGTEQVFDAALIVPDENALLKEMPVAPWRKAQPSLAPFYQELQKALAEHYGQRMTQRWSDCRPEFQHAVLHGSRGAAIPLPSVKKPEERAPRPFEGAIAQLKRLHATTKSELARHRLGQYMSRQPCQTCHGARLKREILAVTLEFPPSTALNINQFCQLSIHAAKEWLEKISWDESREKIGGEIRKEILQRLRFLEEVGLGYLTLNRESDTLSGGEVQRIRLATQIGSKLTGVVYILDEPSIGLHQRDNDRLLGTLRELRDLGNTVIVVEHDEDTIRSADYLVDLGPAAGLRGGYVVASGTVAEVTQNERSLTGRYIAGSEQIRVPRQRQKPGDQWLEVFGATENNLKNIHVAFPLGLLTCVTGVSGSGKSTLVNDVLCNALFRHFYGSKERPGAHQRIAGLAEIDKVIVIDQNPIGRTPRSNPVTYTGAFNGIRDLFSQLPMARVRGYGPGRFSCNVRGGRCEHCEGDGVIKIEMNFLPPVYVTCEACNGRRFNRETLEITYKGSSIADVLEMTVDEALQFFRNIPGIHDKLEALAQVGLGYVKLGQPATTLSGGEAQRIKLASELAKKATGRTVYIMDEPTSGLHFADIDQLLGVLFRLRNDGNTVIIIEHQLDVIKSADYVIDLGPEGGDAGGQVVAKGSPEEVAAHPGSHTGRYLAKILARA